MELSSLSLSFSPLPLVLLVRGQSWMWPSAKRTSARPLKGYCSRASLGSCRRPTRSIRMDSRWVWLENTRLVSQGDCDGGALLFSTGELRRAFFLFARQPDQAEQLARALAPVRETSAAQHQWLLNVHSCAQLWQQIAPALLPDMA